MPLFMDIHGHIEGLLVDAVADARAGNLKTQTQYGVAYLRAWLDEHASKVFVWLKCQ
jgi:hypothetical protein